MKELSNLSSSWTILSVVIITTNKTRVSGFSLILIVNGLCFGLLRLWIIFILLVLTLSFFGFIFAGKGRLNRVHLRSLAGGRGRRWSIFHIRRSRFGVCA